MNAVQQYAQTLLAVEGRFEFTESPFQTRAKIFNLFTQANLALSQASGALIGDRFIDSTAGATDFFYPAPRGVRNWDIRAVQIIGADGQAKGDPLDRIDEEEALKLFGAFDNASGSFGAKYWWPSLNRLGIGPPIGEAIAGGIKVTAILDPIPITRFVSSDSGKKIDVVLGSPSIVFPGGFRPAEGTVQSGDEIGVGSDASLPTRWYRIKSVSASGGELTGATLTENYGESTGSGLAFVASQVSDMVLGAPGHATEWAPVHFAIAKSFMKSDPALAREAMGEFERLKTSTIKISRGKVAIRRPNSAAFGWLRR